MAQLFIDQDYGVYGIRSRNVFGRMDDVCDASGKRVNLIAELSAPTMSGAERNRLIAGVVAAIERQEYPA